MKRNKETSWNQHQQTKSFQRYGPVLLICWQSITSHKKIWAICTKSPFCHVVLTYVLYHVKWAYTFAFQLLWTNKWLFTQKCLFLCPILDEMQNHTSRYSLRNEFPLYTLFNFSINLLLNIIKSSFQREKYS